MEIRGKAPLRLSFAGGGTDLNYIFDKYGGAVVSSTIDKYCHMSISKRKDKKIVVNHKELDDSEQLVQGVIKVIKPKFGFNLIYYNDIKPGSGLGSSSSFVILLIRLLSELDNHVLSDTEIVKKAYEVETSFKEGGWQDQYAAAIGGFNFMEFDKKETRIYPLRLKYSFICELNEHLVLVDVGKQREEDDIHKELREYSLKHKTELKRTSKIKDLAFRMRDCLLNSKIEKVGGILNENWKLKKNKITSNKRLDEIYQIGIENGSTGGKVCGAGQAGHFLFFCKPEDKNRLINALKDKCQVVTFNFANQGVETWRS